MTLRKEKLLGIQKELVARRDSLARELSQATQEFLNDDAMYSDSVDQAAADTDRTIAFSMKNRDVNILNQIDQALSRIEAGTFGECEQCGEEIADARMRANPATTLCIDCKAELESEERRIARA